MGILIFPSTLPQREEEQKEAYEGQRQQQQKEELKKPLLIR